MSEGSSSFGSDLDPYIPIWIALVALMVYTLTLKPVIGWGISAEVAKQSLDVPGTTGTVRFPLRVLLGSAAGQLAWLFPVVPHDLLQNLLSPVFGAASLSVLFLICLRLGWNRASAVITCLTAGLSHLFWHLSVTSGPFPLSMFLLLLLIYTTIRWIHSDRHGGPWWLAGTAFLIGSGVGETPFFLLLLPGFIVLFFSSEHVLQQWRSLLLFLLYILVGYGISLLVMAFLAGGINGSDLIPVAPQQLNRLLETDRLLKDARSFATLFFYQFPLFGLLFGLLGMLVQWGRRRKIGWVLIFPFLLSIPLYSSSQPDLTYYGSSLTFVLFAVWMGEGLGWFLGYASRQRNAMDSSYSSIILAIGTVMCLSPLMLYASAGDTDQRRDRSSFSSVVPGHSFPRMSRTYYLRPWKFNQTDTRLLWKDTRSIPDNSILIAGRLAAEPVRYYMALDGTSGRISIRNPEKEPFRSHPERTTRYWLKNRSTHKGTANEPPKTGLYSLNSDPIYYHQRLKKSFQFDRPLLTGKGGGSPGGSSSAERVHALKPVERAPIWRIRLSSEH